MDASTSFPCAGSVSYPSTQGVSSVVLRGDFITVTDAYVTFRQLIYRAEVVDMAKPRHTTRDRAASDALDKLLASQANQVSAVAEAWRSRYPVTADYENPLEALLHADGSQAANEVACQLTTWYFATLNRSPSLRSKYHFADEISSSIESDMEDDKIDLHIPDTEPEDSKAVSIPRAPRSPTSLFQRLARRIQLRVGATRLTQTALKNWDSLQEDAVMPDPVSIWLAT